MHTPLQGILIAIIALLLYGRMLSVLGATGGAAFVALTPAMAALLAIPLLGEWPSIVDWLAILMICVGVYLVSGGPATCKAGLTLALHCNTASPTVTPCEEACRRRGLDRQRTSARATLSAHQLGGRLGHVR
jgi:EamA-like transporter family